MNLKSGIFAGLLVMGFCLPVVAAPVAKSQAAKKYAPEGSPTRAIQDLDDKVESYVLSPKSDEDRAFNLKLKHEIITGIFDVSELCRLAMDKHWAALPAADQASFIGLMTQLLERKGIFSKEQSNRKGSQGKYFVTYDGDKPLTPDKTLSLVTTHVNIPSERIKIELSYKLKKLAGQWKIYDVIVDQASLLDNYRYQFDRIISKDGYPDLYRRMESKLKGMDEKQGVGGASGGL